MFTDQRVRYGRHAAALALASVLFVVAGMFTAGNQAAHAIGTPPNLGAVGSFAVIGGQEVTNTGDSDLWGDLGVWPGTSITGFPPGEHDGARHETDAVAQQAQSDLTTAYNNVAGQAKDFDSPADARKPGDQSRCAHLDVGGTADGHAHPQRPRRPERGLHLPDPGIADHRLQQHRRLRQRRSTVQRVLADRRLRHDRVRHHLHRNRHGPDVHQRIHRSQRRRTTAGTQRPRLAPEQRHHRAQMLLEHRRG